MKARLNKVDANAMYIWSCLQIHFQYLQIHLKFLTNTFVNVLQIQLKFLTNAFEKEISGEVEKGWQRWQIHLKMCSARQQLNICPASRAHMCQTLCLKNSILPCALRTCLHTIHVHIYSDLLLLTGNSSTCVITHKERQNTKYRPCALGIDIIHV